MAQISTLKFIILVAFLFGNNVLCKAEEKIEEYELKNGDFSVKISTYGATVLSVMVPDKHGNVDDVVLGFDTIDAYKNDTVYFGALVGRVANRIGGAKFTLNGVEYKTPANDHGNTLHGGTRGFSDVIWKMKRYQKEKYLTLTYDSYDGEQGFPGELSVTVTYMLIKTNKLAIKMEAKPLTKATPVNLASHTYWNLGGHNSGDILAHEFQLFASKITSVDKSLIPTGEITSIQGTAFDFLQPRSIGSRLSEVPEGYDINYVLDSTERKHFKKVAIVQEKKSGRKMELWSNQPGVQVYTSGQLDSVKGKGGFTYKKHAGIALETQGFPDSVNHPNFPSQIVNPGETYEHVMLYWFTAN